MKTKSFFLGALLLVLLISFTPVLAADPTEVEPGKEYDVFTSFARNAGGERGSYLLIILKLKTSQDSSSLIGIIDESARITSIEVCGAHIVKAVKVGDLLEAHFFHRKEDTPFYRLPVKAYREVLP